MAAATITVTVLVVLLIVAVAALLMKINKDSKRMDALGSESLVKRMANPPIEQPVVMRPADRIESTVMPPPPRMARPAVMPRRPEDNMRVGSLTLQKAKAAAEAAAKAAVIYTNPSRALPAQGYFAKAQAEREASASDFINDEERLYRPPLQSVEQALAAAKAAAEAAAAKETPPSAAKGPQAPVDDIENVGDQSLMLDEDPSQEYDEMAEETGIAKIAIPQPDENWIKSRQVQPVKDLSVGIAITNDVSKQDNLQAGKITSKFPIRARPTVMPSMPHHKGPQVKPAYFEAMRAAAAKAAQERDAKARSIVDKRARSMAENAEMQALKRIDNSGMKQYDMTKGPPRAMIGIMKPIPTREASLTIAAKMEAEEAANKAAMQAAEAAEYAEHQRKQKVAMKVAKRQAEEAGNKAAMKAAKMQAAEAANKAAMKVANMQAEEAANKAAMKVEGYEMMKPWGSMVY